MLPIAIDRSPYSNNKFDFSVIQAESVLDKVPKGDTSIIVGDSAYLYNKFIHNFGKRENVTVIIRMKTNKAIYEKYENNKEGSGKKRKYDKKYLLNKPNSLPDPGYVEELKKNNKDKSCYHGLDYLYFKDIYDERAKITQCQIYQ